MKEDRMIDRVYNNHAKSIAEINTMKVIATVFVVYVHGANIYGYGGYDRLFSLVPLATMFESAVPTFMAISGFLLFQKRLVFKENLKKRARRLALPFLIWSIFWILFELAGHFVLPGRFSDVLSWNAGQLLVGIFGIPFSVGPFYTPLWYVRDLFLLSVIAPFLQPIIRKLPVLLFLLAVVVWFAPLDLYFRESIAFFLIGAVLAESKKLFRYFREIKAWFGIPAVLIGFLTSISSFWVLNRISTIVMVLTIYCFSKWLTKLEGIRAFCYRMVEYSFLIYVTHGKALSVLQILYAKKFPAKICITIGYFALPAIVFVACYILAILFKRFYPNGFAISIGKRPCLSEDKMNS